MDKIKFYIPDGHLQEKTLGLFKRAGFEVKISDRGYNPEIDDEGIVMKRIRPQDFPFILALDKGDLGIAGSDIIEEFSLKYPEMAGKVEKVLKLGFGSTRLVAAISEEALPGIKSISEFKKYANGKKIVVATEYPEIAGDYLKKNGITGAIIRKPAGKTEAWIIPPVPEADMIIETTETGTTLKENKCLILGDVMTATSWLIANKKSLKGAKKKKIDEIVQLFKGALDAKGKVNVYMDVVDQKNLDKVLKIIGKYVKKPTISNLNGGGYDVFIVIDEKELKYALPDLKEAGASNIAVSDTRMIIE